MTALAANAHPNPAVTASSPAAGATRTCTRTAADQMPLFAATNSSSSTSVGNSELAAGLKNTEPAESPNASA